MIHRIVSHQEWIELAEDYERKERENLEKGDVVASDLAHIKAEACRYAAVYALDEQDTQEATR